MCDVAQRLEDKGEERFAKLMDTLLQKGLLEEAKLASKDEKARKEMYRKYNIID